MLQPDFSSARLVRRLTPTFHTVEWTAPAGTLSDRGCFPQWQVGLTLHGACQYHYSGREVWAATGDLGIIRPGTEMVWRVPEGMGWTVVYAVFDPRPHWLPWLHFPEIVPGCALMRLGDSALFRRARRLLRTTYKVYRGSSPQHDDLAMLHLERLFLDLQGHKREQATDARVRQAMERLEREYARDWTVEELARVCHASPSHLSFLFQEAAGTAPMQYLEGVRMRRAQAMLALGQSSIAEVGRDIGYIYPSYFSRRFRNFTGQTPREYRNAARASVGES